MRYASHCMLFFVDVDAPIDSLLIDPLLLQQPTLSLYSVSIPNMPARRNFRPLSLCETLGKTFQVFASHAPLFLLLSVGIHVPLCINTICFIVSSSLGKNIDKDLWDYLANHGGAAAGYLTVEALLSVVLALAVHAAMVRATAEIYGT